MVKSRLSISFEKQDKILIAASLCFLFSCVIIGGGGEDAAQSSLSMGAINKLILIPIGLVLCFFYMLRNNVNLINKKAILYAVFIAVGFISTVFISTSKLFSTWKMVECSSLLFFCLCVTHANKNYKDKSIFDNPFINLILLFIKALLFYCLIVIILFPSKNLLTQGFSISRAYLKMIVQITTGISLNANSCGVFSAIALFDTFYRLFMRKRKFSAMAVIELIAYSVMIILSQSRTSLLALAIAVFFTVVLCGKRNKLLYLFIVAAAVLLVIYWGDIFEYLLRGRTEEELSNMSGRSDYWPLVFEKVNTTSLLTILFGLGYGVAVRKRYGDYQLASLHSDYVDTIANTGWIGFLTLILYVVSSVISQLIKTIRSFGSALLADNAYKLCLMAIIITRSITGSTIGSLSIFAFLFIALVGFKIPDSKALDKHRRTI